MAKKWRGIAVLTAAVATMSFLASCGGGTSSGSTGTSDSSSSAGNSNSSVPDANLKTGTYRTYTTVMPSNWNELSYEDNNDRQILSYIVSSFFEYDYKFDEAAGGKFNADGTINADAIVPGGFEVKYSAATKLEDVTSTVDAKWGYTAEQKEAGGYAWKITLRDDLTWDDGTPIDASDFVYTMKEQLSPDFFNMRASTYYMNIMVQNAREYLYSKSEKVYASVASQGLTADKALAQYGDMYIDVWNFYNAKGYVDADGNECPQYVSVKDETLYDKAAAWEAGEPVDQFSGKAIYEAYYGSDLDESSLYVLVENEDLGIPFEDVGFYSPSQYELVVCLDSPIYMLKEDGTLSYEAAYSFQGFPLVKEDLYEKCKQKPSTGSTLWTSNYNTSLETSASWGPYKLTQYQRGKAYTLERNDNWFGYDLADNANQYNITKIECEQIKEVNTQWMKFLSGGIDEIGLDVTHKEDYRNSKYTFYAPGTGTFGINLYANLPVLKNNGRNNTILAIPEFREAISLFLNRDEYNATCYTSHQSCYGLLGPSYYYDVENGGVYRDTQYAKEALLRVYGFTQDEKGIWSDGVNRYPTYEDAYEAMNGMNRTLAKQLVEKAYQEMIGDSATYGYDSSKKITLVFGTAEDNENTRRNYEYIQKTITEMVQGTSLEGKIEVTFDASSGAGWADAFKSGAYEIAAGTGFSGGAFDPEGFLQCYLDPEAKLMFSTWWKTDSEEITYTMPEGDYAESGKTLTMSVYNWYCCLNSIAESRGQKYTYNWGAGAVSEEVRMQILAMLEEYTLKQYYTIVTTSEYSASLLGAKFSYVSGEYNIFMGFGGYRYMIVNYTDSEWTTYASNTNLEAEYKKTN